MRAAKVPTGACPGLIHADASSALADVMCVTDL
jgi:hypothetical protein